MADTVSEAERIDRLERALARQADEIDRLRSLLDPHATPEPVATDGAHADARAGRTSRRTMLRRGAVAAGAALVGASARPGRVAAGDGDNLVIGNNNTSPAGNTRLRTPAPGADLSNANILTVSDSATSSAYPAAIGAIAQGSRIHNGMYTFASSRIDGNSNTGHALIVRPTSGARSAIYLVPGGIAPTSDSYAHRRGSIRVDSGGNFWYCVSSGTPGTWRKVAGFASAGAVHTLDPPRRAYDSRFTDGPLTAGFERTVSVANAIDVTSGAVTLFDMVPSGATAVLFNLAITETAGGGFLQVAPGTASAVTAATINWAASGVTLSNASFSSLDTDRQVKVLSGGAGATQFIIDITGYML